MDPNTEPAAHAPSRSRSRANPSSAPASPPTYGYHNTFHTHTQLPVGTPPTYARAIDPKVLQHLDARTRQEARFVRSEPSPPAYDCSIEIGGVVGIKQELLSPFLVSSHREWNDFYAILRGTQLSLHRVKKAGLFSKDQRPTPGRFLRTYSLQHSEVGVASDFKKTALTPKSPFAHLVPAAARPKLYETDPHLFEPVREHAIRLRLELEQFLLCPTSEELMLSWVEALTAAIDISLPLEDRSESRYRSLPRRSRRQRILDGAHLGESIENLSSAEAGRRIIAQQEQIIRTLYPHLAGIQEPSRERTAPAAELELDEFDPEDVRFPTRPPRDSLSHSRSQEEEHGEDERPSSSAPFDPKAAPRIRPSAAQELRYRRRCAPVLLACSPRVSDVVFFDGQRVRIIVKDHSLIEFESHPPRYDAHNFPKSKRPPKISTSRSTPVLAADKREPAVVASERPGSPTRGVSDDSITSISFGEDLAPARSESNPDEISSSGPPSPTALVHSKADSARQLLAMGKRRASEDSREAGLSAVTFGVGMLI